MKIEIHSKEELYNKVYRVLTIRKKNLLKENFNVSEEMLWYFFSEEIFVKMKNLTLAEVVDKILKIDSEDIRKYLVRNHFM
ncbi:MAG: hypothetical protein HFJ38_05590 [Bacilli bacterium]|nr:hypothetical protein [Bacilli bacterium]